MINFLLGIAILGVYIRGVLPCLHKELEIRKFTAAMFVKKKKTCNKLIVY